MMLDCLGIMLLSLGFCSSSFLSNFWRSFVFCLIFFGYIVWDCLDYFSWILGIFICFHFLEAFARGEEIRKPGNPASQPRKLVLNVWGCSSLPLLKRAVEEEKPELVNGSGNRDALCRMLSFLGTSTTWLFSV